MKKLVLILALLILAVLGCVPSLHPLYNKNNTIYDQNLLGQWKSDDPNWQWHFEKYIPSAKKYELTILDKDKQGDFDVRLVKIADSNYLDFSPGDEPQMPECDFYKMHFIGVHTFAKICPDPNGYKISFMGGDKFQDKIEAEPNIVKCEFVNDNIILTAANDELVKFIEKYSSEKWLFDFDSFIIYPLLSDHLNTDVNNNDTNGFLPR